VGLNCIFYFGKWLFLDVFVCDERIHLSILARRRSRVQDASSAIESSGIRVAELSGIGTIAEIVARTIVGTIARTIAGTVATCRDVRRDEDVVTGLNPLA
jgi:hypothetical protein